MLVNHTYLAVFELASFWSLFFWIVFTLPHMDTEQSSIYNKFGIFVQYLCVAFISKKLINHLVNLYGKAGFNLIRLIYTFDHHRFSVHLFVQKENIIKKNHWKVRWVFVFFTFKDSKMVIVTAKWIWDRSIFSSKFPMQDNVDSCVL